MQLFIFIGSNMKSIKVLIKWLLQTIYIDYYCRKVPVFTLTEESLDQLL